MNFFVLPLVEVLISLMYFTELSCQQMTIGKIHCAKLIHENYKYLKRKGTQTERVSSKTDPLCLHYPPFC